MLLNEKHGLSTVVENIFWGKLVCCMDNGPRYHVVVVDVSSVYDSEISGLMAKSLLIRKRDPR